MFLTIELILCVRIKGVQDIGLRILVVWQQELALYMAALMGLIRSTGKAL